jgi:hypothetical protein
MKPLRLNVKIHSFAYKDEHEWCFIDSVGEVVYEVDDGTWLDEFTTENEALETLHFYRDEVKPGRLPLVEASIRNAKLPRIHKAHPSI